MGSLTTPPAPHPEGVNLTYLPPSERDEAVAALDHPWIAEEGPLTVDFRRGGEPHDLRGLAFDEQCTVQWDEAQVLVIRRDRPENATTAFCTPVLRWDRFKPPEGQGPPNLLRIDYLRDGTLVASRYVTDEPRKEGKDA